jgi:hypothetical protein
MAFSFTARSSVPKRMFDAFAGGPAPINPPYEVSVTWNKSESGAFKSHIPGGVRGVGWCMHDGVFGILLPDTTLFLGEPLSNVNVSADDFLSAGIAGSNPWGLPSSPRRTVVLFSVRETWTGALSASGGFAGPRNLSWTRTGTGEVAAGLTGDTRVDKPVVAAYTVNEARTVAGVGTGPITNDLTVRLRYETMDYHTQALALRSINEATGYWEAQAPLGANPTRASTVVYRDQFKLPAHVIDRSSKVLAGWDDIVARFSSVPVACLPRVNGGATMLYGMPDVPIAPPNEFTTGTTVAPADTAEFLSPFGGFYFVRAFDFDAKMDYGPRPYYSELPEYIPRTGTDVSLDAATAPQGRMTRAEFVGHYPASLFADPSYLPAIQYLQPGGQAMQGEITESYQVGDGGRPENLRARENILLRDLRNGGYIVQTHWLGERFDRTDVPFYETLIANESGAVRLVDVLNEWLALGENAVVMDHVFIDHPVPGTAVALL